MRNVYGRYITIDITTSEENTDLVELIKEKNDKRNCDIFKMSIMVNKDCNCIINNKDELKLTADYGFCKDIEDPNIKSFVIKEIGIKVYAIIGY